MPSPNWRGITVANAVGPVPAVNVEQSITFTSGDLPAGTAVGDWVVVVAWWTFLNSAGIDWELTTEPDPLDGWSAAKSFNAGAGSGRRGTQAALWYGPYDPAMLSATVGVTWRNSGLNSGSYYLRGAIMSWATNGSPVLHPEELDGTTTTSGPAGSVVAPSTTPSATPNGWRSLPALPYSDLLTVGVDSAIMFFGIAAMDRGGYLSTGFAPGDDEGCTYRGAWPVAGGSGAGTANLWVADRKLPAGGTIDGPRTTLNWTSFGGTYAGFTSLVVEKGPNVGIYRRRVVLGANAGIG